MILALSVPMWPRYEILLEVANGNCALYSHKQNHNVLEETNPINILYA
jgi:hypothetical protein